MSEQLCDSFYLKQEVRMEKVSKLENHFIMSINLNSVFGSMIYCVADEL